MGSTMYSTRYSTMYRTICSTIYSTMYSNMYNITIILSCTSKLYCTMYHNMFSSTTILHKDDKTQCKYTHIQTVEEVAGFTNGWIVFVPLLYFYLYLFRHWKTQYFVVCYSRVETSPVNNVN